MSSKHYWVYGLGLSLCLEVAVSGLIGWWLGEVVDEKFHTRPWGVAVGLILFVVASCVHVFWVLQRYGEKKASDEQEAGPRGNA